MTHRLSIPVRLPLSFGLRWPLAGLTYCALQLGLACRAGPVWLSVVPFAATIFGAGMAGAAGEFRATRAALGAGFAAALGLLATNAAWHLLWPSAALDCGWNWGIAEGIWAHLEAFVSAFALTSFHLAAVCVVIRALRHRSEQSAVRRALVASSAAGWILAWGLLMRSLVSSAGSEFHRVPLLAWYPGELAYRGYLAAVTAVAAFPLLCLIARRRERRQQATNPRPTYGELDWDRDQFRRPTIHLPAPR